MAGPGSSASVESKRANHADFLRLGDVTPRPLSEGSKCQMSLLSVGFQEQFGSTCRCVCADCSKRKKCPFWTGLGYHSVIRFFSSLNRSRPSFAAFRPSISFPWTVYPIPLPSVAHPNAEKAARISRVWFRV